MDSEKVGSWWAPKRELKKERYYGRPQSKGKDEEAKTAQTG